MKQIIIFLLIITARTVMACDCKEINDLQEEREWSIQFHNLIFIAEVVSTDDKGHYSIKIIELFKGEISNKIISGSTFTSCSAFPSPVNSIWLIYANYGSENVIDISQCGLSRNFENPFVFSKETHLPPPLKNVNDSLLVDEYIKNMYVQFKYQQRALGILKKEIELLRSKKNYK